MENWMESNALTEPIISDEQETRMEHNYASDFSLEIGDVTNERTIEFIFDRIYTGKRLNNSGAKGGARERAERAAFEHGGI